MSERTVERDERGKEIVYVNEKYVPNKFMWSKHINNLVEQGKIEAAMKAARDMMNLGIEPDVVTFTTLINGWCKIGKMSVAIRVTNVMLKMGLYPDQITYSTLIQGYCQQHDMMMAKRLVESMTKVNLIPNIITFNQIIKGLCDMHLVGDATILVDTLLKSDTKPSVITFNTLLRGWCDVGDMKMAYKILKSMIELGYEHYTHARLDRVEEHGSCNGLVQADEEKQTSASNYRDIHLADLWLGSIDGTYGHGREGNARFDE